MFPLAFIIYIKNLYNKIINTETYQQLHGSINKSMSSSKNHKEYWNFKKKKEKNYGNKHLKNAYVFTSWPLILKIINEVYIQICNNVTYTLYYLPSQYSFTLLASSLNLPTFNKGRFRGLTFSIPIHQSCYPLFHFVV